MVLYLESKELRNCINVRSKELRKKDIELLRYNFIFHCFLCMSFLLFMPAVLCYLDSTQIIEVANVRDATVKVAEDSSQSRRGNFHCIHHHFIIT